MADLEDRKTYTTHYDGLLTNAYILGAAALVAVACYEVATRRRRLPAAAAVAANPDAWACGHVYRGRCFHALTPTPQPPRWPLAWIVRAVRQPDWWYATHVGLDALAYVRFLRAATWWMAAQLLTTAPALLALHLSHSRCDARSDMACASLANLVTAPVDPTQCSTLAAPGCPRAPNPAGRRWLGLHLLAMSWMTLSWAAALVWAFSGLIAVRRRLLLRARARMYAAAAPPSPSRIQVEAIVDQLARQAGRAADAAHPFVSVAAAERDPALSAWRQRTLMWTQLPSALRNEHALCRYVEDCLDARADQADDRPSPVLDTVLVRSYEGLHALVRRRQRALMKLEEAHMQLADNVLQAVRAVQQATSMAQQHLTHSHLILHQHLHRFLSPESHHDDTFWHTLHALPRVLLDPFQPVAPLVYGPARGVLVPTIDLLSIKLTHLTSLIVHARAAPRNTQPSTDIAFVTLRDPRQARLLVREMHGVVAPHVTHAPEARDLMWGRMHATLTSRAVRALGVSTFFWTLTIFWMIPTQAAASVLSNIGGVTHAWGADRDVFSGHSQWLRFVSATLPSLLVSSVMLLVPEFIYQVHLRTRGCYTRTELYDHCLCRYWKFVICNTVILFSVGSTTLQTFLARVQNQHEASLLETIAFSFPSAAPFFCAYLMLTTATQSGADLAQVPVGLILALRASISRTPRERARWVRPRKFGHAVWLPLHLTVMTIVFLFAIFNPLVIPFAMVYLWCALVVFKLSLANVYMRRFHEHQGTLYAKRFIRFSLDGLVVAQIVLTLFFAVTRQRAVYTVLTVTLVPLTLALKWVGTRLLLAHARALEDDEANVLAGLDIIPSWIAFDAPRVPPASSPRARGRFPTRIPRVADESVAWRRWHRILDTFCAFGYDSPGWIALLYSPTRRALLARCDVRLDLTPPTLLRPLVTIFRLLSSRSADWHSYHASFDAHLPRASATLPTNIGATASWPETSSRACLTSPSQLASGEWGDKCHRGSWRDVCPSTVGFISHPPLPSARTSELQAESELRLPPTLSLWQTASCKEGGVQLDLTRSSSIPLPPSPSPSLHPNAKLIRIGSKGLSSEGSRVSLESATSDLSLTLDALAPRSATQSASGTPHSIDTPWNDHRSEDTTLKRRTYSPCSPGSTRGGASATVKSRTEPVPLTNSPLCMPAQPTRDDVGGTAQMGIKVDTQCTAAFASAPGLPSSAASGRLSQSFQSQPQCQPSQLSQPRPPLTWDDRPDDLAHYLPPALGAPLEQALWLPNHPVYLDLARTLTWLGPAFHSSYTSHLAPAACDDLAATAQPLTQAQLQTHTQAQAQMYRQLLQAVQDEEAQASAHSLAQRARLAVPFWR